PESSRVDVAASAERAEAAAGFSIAVPEPGDTWQERSARFDDGQEPRWQIDYTSPQGQLVVLVQGPQLSAAMLSSAVPGAVVEQEQQIDGVDCQVLSGSGDGQGLHAVACDGEGWGFVTRGEGELEELEVLASAAIESLSWSPPNIGSLRGGDSSPARGDSVPDARPRPRKPPLAAAGEHAAPPPPAYERPHARL